jgi:hypothetical protein
MGDLGLADALRRRASDQPPRASMGRPREALLADRDPCRAAASRGANAVDLGEPFDVECFDAQAVAHPLR